MRHIEPGVKCPVPNNSTVTNRKMKNNSTLVVINRYGYNNMSFGLTLILYSSIKMRIIIFIMSVTILF